MKIIYPEGLSPEEIVRFRRNESNRRNYHKNPDKRKAISSQQRAKNIEAKRQYGRDHYHANKDVYKEAFAKFCENNPNYSKEYNQVYQQTNAHVYAYHAARRRSSLKNATPLWLSSADLISIKQIYKQAKEQNMQVDHIVPLKGNNVCGLHVPWNLQLLTKKENRAKSNKFTSKDVEVLV